MIRPNQNKVVILDLGNVVLNWDVDLILASLNLKPKEKNLLQEELFFHQDWLDMDCGKESETVVVSRVCERSSLSQDLVEKALLAAKKLLTPITESLLLMQEISDNEIEMLCLSNMSRETYDFIKNQELFSMFSGVVISGVEKCMKPDEEIFQLIIGRFSLETQNTLFIDDSLENINSASLLDINGYHFKRSQKCYSDIRKLLF